MTIKNPYGYACINLTLQKQGIYTGRSMIQKTLKQKGLTYVSQLALQNVKDLKQIILWNIKNNFEVFRMSSDIFPWWNTYQISDLQDFQQINSILQEIGKIATNGNLRLSFHPDHFNKLGSPNELIVEKTIYDIEQHSKVFDLMGFIPSRLNKINIHLGGSYEDKNATIERFCQNFKKLSINAQSRLTIENDDKLALYSVVDLLNVHNKIGIPIVFDLHHHKFNNGNLSEEEAFLIAYQTWQKDGEIIPIFHYSESSETSERGHSDYVKTKSINSYGKPTYFIVEAKAKDLAVMELMGVKV